MNPMSGIGRILNLRTTMTRVNLVPVKELMDQHLIAECKELHQLSGGLRKSFNSKQGLTLDRVPKKFTLGKGHCLFFADKALYIARRYQEIKHEMLQRGFNCNWPEVNLDNWPKEFHKDWNPSENDLNIVRERIAQKLNQKPGWYRYYGSPI